MIELNSPEFNLYHNSNLNQFEFDFKNLFDVLKESISYNEILINKNKTQLDKFISKDSILKNSICDCDTENYFNGIYGDNVQYINCLEMTLRCANLISSFSLFENKISELCQFIESISSKKIKTFENKIKKIKDDKIDNSIINISFLYINDILNVEIEQLIPNKEILFKYKIIRNSVTHNSSIIKNDQFEEVKDLKNLKITWIGNNYYCHLDSPKFLFELINIMENIYLNILQIIDEKIHFDNTKKDTIRNF